VECGTISAFVGVFTNNKRVAQSEAYEQVQQGKKPKYKCNND
jgi:hypothetical protein